VTSWPLYLREGVPSTLHDLSTVRMQFSAGLEHAILYFLINSDLLGNKLSLFRHSATPFRPRYQGDPNFFVRLFLGDNKTCLNAVFHGILTSSITEFT